MTLGELMKKAEHLQLSDNNDIELFTSDGFRIVDAQIMYLPGRSPGLYLVDTEKEENC